MRLIVTLGALAVMSIATAQAEDAKPYIDNKIVDLVQILPPPPPNDSQ